MARKTSIEAYNNIKENGLLSKRRWEVYRTLFKYGPLTSAECFKYLSDSRKEGIISQSRARFTELREMGVICEIGERNCKVTGKNVIEWDVTNLNSPKQPKKKTTKKELKKEMLKDLQLMWEGISDPTDKFKLLPVKNRLKRILTRL